MPTKRVIIANSIICCTLLVLSFFVFNLSVTPATFQVNAPLSNGGSDKNQVALMFIVDETTTANNLSDIINTLTNAQANATFFITGSIAIDNLAIMQELGTKFEIGNYGFSNANLDTADKKLITEEISLGGTLLQSLTKQAPHFFTPYDGNYNKHTLTIAQNLGYQTVLPTDRDLKVDWELADANLVASYATYKTKAGDIIALKPTNATRQCLSQIIADFLSRNLTITSLGQLLA